MENLKTAPFREQHDRLIGIVEKISTCLTDKSEVFENSNVINKLLRDLSRNLKVHLALEDTSLYSILLLSGNKELEKAAREYMDEMGNIKEIYVKYSNQWSSGFPIREDPEGFIKETKLLFNSLGDRIDRENNGLYVMIDEMYQ